MILILFNIFLFTLEILSLCFKCLWIFGQQIFKYFCPQTPKEMDGQIVLITGAGSGIGRALAIRFAKMNAITVLWDIDRDSVEKSAKQVRRLGGTAHAMVVDVSDEKKVEMMAKQVKEQIGDVYMLVNNAGVVPCLPFKQLTYQQIRRTFSVNLLSHFWTIKQFLPAMEERGSGHIVAIASSAGIMGSAYFTAYGSSKYGIVGLMASLEKELNELDPDKRSPIKLTTICPLGISGTRIDIPTRTRFPKILPIMTLDYAVDEMFNAILTEEQLVVIPFTFKLIYFIHRLCPLKISQYLFEFLDYAVEPHGFNAPIGRSHYNDNRDNEMRDNFRNNH